MLDESGFKRIADRVLARSKADQTEVVAIGTDSALTRFASSAIHQNVAERDSEVRVRAVIGRRVGVATTNELSDRSLDRAVERAVEVARNQPETPGFPGLPGPTPVRSVDGWRAETAACSPDRRARLAKAICDLALERNLNASGAVTTESHAVGVANSQGVLVHERRSRAHLVTVMMDDDGTGYAERTSISVDQIDAESAGREAVDLALRSREPVRLPPGEYPVVLREYAVGELLTYLAYMGFGALAYEEGHSFLRGKLGQRIVDDRISIWDDGSDPRGLPSGFDFEGIARQRVDIVERGVAKGVVYDTQTAARAGRSSTGHALPAPNTFGPFPTHLTVGAGNTPLAELARGLERGIWVTRFHYVNVVQPDRAILTGMTRDGTFLIEHGEVTRPIKNLRFTQSITESWSGLVALGDTLSLIDSWGGGVLVPAMRLEKLTFTGVSEGD